MLKLKSWSDPEANDENGYYLERNDAKVTNFKIASMQSTFEFDVKKLDTFSFKDYGLYLDLSDLNRLAPQKDIPVTIPVKKKHQKLIDKSESEHDYTCSLFIC